MKHNMRGLGLVALAAAALACEPPKPDTNVRQGSGSSGVVGGPSIGGHGVCEAPASGTQSGGGSVARGSGVISVPPFQGVQMLEDPPPPISGGTLLVLADGVTAVASDPDRDAVSIVELATQTRRAHIALPAKAEPGRAVEGTAGTVHVVLRGANGVATINVAAGTLVRNTPVCGAPRGIAYDATRQQLFVACATGEVMALDEGAGTVVWRVVLEPDLRDVVVTSQGLLVSLFRAAQALHVNADTGALLARITVPGVESVFRPYAPSVAWRMIPAPQLDGALMLHQLSLRAEIPPAPGGYGGAASGPGGPEERTNLILYRVALVRPGMATPASPLLRSDGTGVDLLMDVALSADGSQIAVGGPGAAHRGRPQVYSAARVCFLEEECLNRQIFAGGQLTAVAFTGGGAIIFQTREPASVQSRDGAGFLVALAQDPRGDTGHTVFHSTGGAGVACASCHPEGREDGVAWRFFGIGERRTQSLLGGVTNRSPFHWDGDQPTLRHLMADVFSGRMSGPQLTAEQVTAVGHWLDALPELPPVAGVDQERAQRGQALFEDPLLGCQDCHQGPNGNCNVNVGTGKAFQIPSLSGVAWRTPLLHNGCAVTLMDRFTTCANGDLHGFTSHLSNTELGDLVAFLETL